MNDDDHFLKRKRLVIGKRLSSTVPYIIMFRL